MNEISSPGRLVPDVGKLCTRYGAIFAAAYALTFLVYGYLFTTVILTNHLLPAVWVAPYPSGKTSIEGRWFADLIIQFTGGSGVQSFQMATAAALQIINAFLFAELLGIKDRLRILLVALLLAVHPAFLDYYSFTVDHLSFVAGDTIALLGVLTLDRLPGRRIGAVAAIGCFVLTMATYQPKIALIAILLLIWCLQATGQRRPWLSRILVAALVGAVAVALYGASALLVVQHFDPTPHNHINDLAAMVEQILRAYPATLWLFTTRIEYLPRALIFLPALAVGLGILGLLWRMPRRYWLVCLLLVALFPVALQLSYVVNDETWGGAGRIYAPHAYFLVFSLTSAWRVPALRHLIPVTICVLIYFFSTVGLQEVNTAALMADFEWQKINRIVSRMENVAPDVDQRPRAVVVIGSLGFQSEQPLRKYSNAPYGAAITAEAFAPFRQVQILNFFLGRRVLTLPTMAQVDGVLATQQWRHPWPAPDSVYLQDGVIVILLQPYVAGVAVTSPR